MYVPPDEPVKDVGEVNMTYEHDDNTQQHQQENQWNESQQQTAEENLDVTPSTSSNEPTASVNPIYQRYVQIGNFITFY